jgi:hypothetical protein
MEFPEDIEKVGLGVSFRPAGVTKRKRETTKKAIESEESEWRKSDASLHERFGRERCAGPSRAPII